jgi:hypothetical protein
MNGLIVPIAALLVAGCALPQRSVEIFALSNGTEVVSYPADLRGAYAVGSKVCAEPVPDVAMASTEKLTGAVKLLSATGQSIEANAAANLAASVAELTGRTQLVLLARDLLYRVCEAGLNNPDLDQAALFERVADLVEALGRAEENRAAADAATARRLEANGASIDAILVAP